MIILVICCLAIVLTDVSSFEISKPNIVFIVADDLGWDDVSFHGSDQILTPNIDTLAYHGVILQQYYTDTMGTPSRSALFTGKYPFRLGTQSTSIKASEDRGIPVSEPLLPAYLRDLGYETHLIGKWHVGKSREHYLPTYRGFDTFYGCLGGSVDYYTYNLVENWNETSYFGLDLFDGEMAAEDQSGHITDVLTDRAIQVIRDHNGTSPLYLHVSHVAPHTGGGLVNLQPPMEAIAANAHIAHSARRLYAGLVTSLDRSVGMIVSALAERGLLQDTLIVFVSDNGAPTTGPTQNYGINLPLRGVKETPWEGATRSIGLFWHAALPSQIWSGLFHVTDWLPTLVAIAGGSVEGKIDGVNQWNAIINEENSKRSEIIITMDDLNGWAAIRDGDLKLVIGAVDEGRSNFQGENLKDMRLECPSYEESLLECEVLTVLRETLDMFLNIDEAFEKRNNTILLTYVTYENNKLCIPSKVKGCLFNVTADPLETRDLWEYSPDEVQHMALRLRELWTEIRPRQYPKPDSRANPALREFTWSPWLSNEERAPESPNNPPPFPLQVTLGELKYLVDLNVNSFKDKIFETIQSMGDAFVKSVRGLFPF